MIRFITCVVLYLSVTDGQIVPTPYGPSPLPGVPTVPLPTAAAAAAAAAAATAAAAAARAAALGFNPALAPVPPFRPIPGVPVPPIPGVRDPYYNYNGLRPAVPILTYYNEPAHTDGTYAFSFSTADGKQAQENGFLKDAYIDNNGEPQGTQVVQGSYAYISPDGTPVQVSYVADENGFRPSGVHIPADGTGTVPVLPGLINSLRNYTAGGRHPAYNPYNPYNPAAIHPLGYNHLPHNTYNPAAYHPAAYNPAAYHPAAYNPAAYNPAAYNPAAYNPAAYNAAGYHPGAYNPGYNKNAQDTGKKD